MINNNRGYNYSKSKEINFTVFQFKGDYFYRHSLPLRALNRRRPDEYSLYKQHTENNGWYKVPIGVDIDSWEWLE